MLNSRMTVAVEYRLQGSGGCLKWLWDHDLLSIVPEYNSTNHCSTSARLKSIAPYNGRKVTAVYAVDVHNGVVTRCKVFIDNISRIQIIHHSVKLNLDGLATLHVRAFDSKENEFSSLVGLPFMWQLMPEAEGLSHHLVNVPLKDSPLSDCGDLDAQISLEDSGAFSNLYVVKGVEIGHEVVSVHMLEPQFRHMSYKIVLTVAEAMSLHPPSPFFVLVGAVVPYTLKVIRANISQVVALPSPHHHWSVSNSSVSEVDSTMGLAYALSLGMTSVIVEDVRIAGHVQLSSLNVVLPNSISLYLTPLSSSGDVVGDMISVPSMVRWYVVSGRQYLIQIKVFSPGPGAQEIYITEKDDIKVYGNQSKYWKTLSVSNGIASKHDWKNSRILKAYNQGLGKLTTALAYSVVLHQPKKVLKSVQEIMVCDQVKLSLEENVESPRILLPWAPTVLQELELKATGGCAKVSSDYKWLSSDASIVSVSAFGVVQARNPGCATIKVISMYDSLNYDEVLIEVSIPTTMVMVQAFPIETVIGSHLQAAVTMKASNGEYFYKCDAFSSFIKWKAGSGSFVIVNSTLEASLLDTHGDTVDRVLSFGPQCSRTFVYASAPGFTMLHATFSKEKHDDSHPSFCGTFVLKASSHIAAYPHLDIVQAGDGNESGGYWLNVSEADADKQVGKLHKLYLVPGTQVDVVLLGGPQRWGRGVDYVESVEVLDEESSLVKDGVSVEQVSGSDRRTYRVSCQKLGTFKLVFQCGNMFGDDHPLPALAEASLSLLCSIPSSIVLQADEPANQLVAIRAERGTGGLHDNPITVANGHAIRLSVVGISDSGDPFANSSSLLLLWELSNCEGLAYWDDTYDSMKSMKWERSLVLQNESGQCIIRATVTNFVDATGNTYFADLLDLEYVRTDAICLQIRVGAHLHPQNPVHHVDHSLNFTGRGLTENLNVRWFTTNGSIISVDTISRRVEAEGEGLAQGLNLQTTINMTKGNLISVYAPREILSNVPYPTKGYKFPIKFSAHGGKSEAVGNSKEVLYDCTVDPPFLGYARAWLDLDTGYPCCLFFPYSPEHLVHSVPKLDGVRPHITMFVNASLRESKHVSGSAAALFVGGFSLLETGKGSLQMNLTPDYKMTSITILGNIDVDIHWREKDSLMVAPVLKEQCGIVGRACYEVRMLKTKKFKDKIIITLPANGQRLELDVNYEPGEGIAKGTPIWLWIIFLVCALVLRLVEVWYTDRTTRSQQSNVRNLSPRLPKQCLEYFRATIHEIPCYSATSSQRLNGFSGPSLAPDWSSPSVARNWPSRTPPEVVEYLRRTIDEAPYYYLHGKIRYNLGNTY